MWPYWSHNLGCWIKHFIVWSITHILTYYLTLHHVTTLFALFSYVVTHILQSCHFCANCTNHRFPNFVNIGVFWVRGWDNSQCCQPVPPEQYSFEYNHFKDSQKSSWKPEKKHLSHVWEKYSQTFILKRCNCCHRNVHRNCTQFSCDEFTVVKTGAFWYCRICSEKIFPFNNIDDHEFHLAITETEMKLFDANHQNKFSESKIFDPFEINENDDSMIEYQDELDPDKHYFKQLAHYLSRSSNYYSEKTLSKLISLKGINSEGLSGLHANIRSVPANLSNFVSYMSNINFCFSVIGLSETWLSPLHTLISLNLI